MIHKMAHAEANVEVLLNARKKWENCRHMIRYTGHNACSLFQHTFDTSFDMFYHCAACKANTSKPTTVKDRMRS